jgi:hypothetical protein
MAWRLSGNPLPALMSWEKKALMLRTVVLSIPALQKLPVDVAERLDAMRAFNRGTITIEELRGRLAALPKDSKQVAMLHEPLDFHGWTVDASLIDHHDSAWWFVHATRKVRTVSEGDKRWLFKVLGVLGCNPEADRVSLGDLETNVAESVPYIYMWPNTFERLEVQLKKGDMRVVPRGTRPADGFSRIDDADVGKE